jgi:MFS family permease
LSNEANERIHESAHHRARVTGQQPGGPGRAVVVMAAITALGGLLFGYDTGVVSGALLFLKDDFPHITAIQKELVTSLLLVGAAIGAIGAARLADRIGRRPTILITAVVFVVGVLLAAFTGWPPSPRCCCSRAC